MFVVFSVHPGIITFTFMFMVYMTILLCAAVVSDGLFVAVFAVMSFLSAGLSSIRLVQVSIRVLLPFRER